jgi:hypothetical protein
VKLDSVNKIDAVKKIMPSDHLEDLFSITLKFSEGLT